MIKTTSRQDKAVLLETARAIAHELKQICDGTAIRIRTPGRLGSTLSNGWFTMVGDLGNGRPRLEVSLDYYFGGQQRKFWFGFFSENRSSLEKIAKRVARKLKPCRTITERDETKKRFIFLRSGLRRAEFGLPILYVYPSLHQNYYGIYDPAVRSAVSAFNPRLCSRAAAFFESVSRTLPNAHPEDSNREVYPQKENRRKVVSHLRRERSRWLATERKIEDDYKCQVCGMRFEEVYGELGRGFAEAHHIVPLSRLKGEVKTRIEDLRTVCANCHRMLHRMDGERSDIASLRRRLR
jgi:5-methylcytosine-specific restriction endonuclease McrA